MNRKLRRLRNVALLAVVRDLRINGLTLRRVLELRAHQLRISGNTMRFQLKSIDIHLARSSYQPVHDFVTEARLVDKDLPLFSGKDREQPLTLKGVQSILYRERRKWRRTT